MTYFSRVGKDDQEKNIKGIANLNLIVLLGIFIILITFLVQTNNLVARSYQLSHYRDLISKQEDSSSKAGINLAEISSMNNLKQVAGRLNLVAIEKIKYLELPETAVALLKSFNR